MVCEELWLLLRSWGFVCLVLWVFWSKNFINSCYCKKNSSVIFFYIESCKVIKWINFLIFNKIKIN